MEEDPELDSEEGEWSGDELDFGKKSKKDGGKKGGEKPKAEDDE